MKTLDKEKLDLIVSQIRYGADGKPTHFKGYPVKSMLWCAKHKIWYPTTYGDELAIWDINLGCPHCAKEALFESALGAAAIPRRFISKSFDTFDANTDHLAKAFSVAKGFASNLKENLAIGRCLVFCGGVGVGKTHLACSIANQAVQEGYSVFFTSVSRLIRQVRATWQTSDELSVYQNLIDLDLLIIDEVGVQAGSENEKNILFDVINGRYENMKSTIVITNLMRQQLPEYMGERVIDRLRENGGVIIPMPGSSYRK